MPDKISKRYTAVVYTDGSWVPGKLSQYGGGCHGYLYAEDGYKNNGDRPTTHSVTDQGYKDKSEMQPEFKIVKPELYYNAVYPYGIQGTNNKAELRSVIDTIEILAANHDLDKIIVYSDSSYTIGVFNAVAKDKTKRNWNTPDRANVDLWNMLADTLVAHDGIHIELRKIAAHGTAVGNNLADRLAYTAREMGAKNITEPLFKFYTGKYWKAKPVPHPLLNFKQLYFNVGIMPDTSESLYVTMDYPSSVELGKKSPEPLFGISIFKSGVPEVDYVVDTYKKHLKGYMFLSAIDLRTLHSQHYHTLSMLLGEHTFTFMKNKRLMVTGDTLLVTPINPPGLAQNALAKTLEMYNVYKHYIANGVSDDGVTKSIDVTDQFYDINKKGKFVFKHAQAATGMDVSYELDGNNVTKALTYAHDTLTYNQFRRLGADNPKIILILKRYGKKQYEYSLLIDTDSAIGLYGNYYINRVYL